MVPAAETIKLIERTAGRIPTTPRRCMVHRISIRCRSNVRAVQRVAIIGPGGSGKSELARQIAARTGLPVTHLDVLFWREGWTPAPTEEATAKLAAVVAGERWIVDGNFLAEDAHRFARADTVIFLDLPRRTCLWRIAKRLVRDRRRVRADLPDGCRESLDPDGIRWIWHYRRRDRPQVLRLLATVDGTVHRLTTRADVQRFVAMLR